MEAFLWASERRYRRQDGGCFGRRWHRWLWKPSMSNGVVHVREKPRKLLQPIKWPTYITWKIVLAWNSSVTRSFGVWNRTAKECVFWRRFHMPRFVFNRIMNTFISHSKYIEKAFVRNARERREPLLKYRWNLLSVIYHTVPQRTWQMICLTCPKQQLHYALRHFKKW